MSPAPSTLVRQEVRDLAALGPLPSEEAPEQEIDRFSDALERIPRPLSDAEARLLVTSFGPDECFGVAWTLLHAIETAPGPAVPEAPGADANEWVRRLWERWQRARLQRG